MEGFGALVIESRHPPHGHRSFLTRITILAIPPRIRKSFFTFWETNEKDQEANKCRFILIYFGQNIILERVSGPNLIFCE